MNYIIETSNWLYQINTDICKNDYKNPYQVFVEVATRVAEIFGRGSIDYEQLEFSEEVSWEEMSDPSWGILILCYEQGETNPEKQILIKGSVVLANAGFHKTAQALIDVENKAIEEIDQ